VASSLIDILLLTITLHTLLKHNQRSPGRHQLRELGDTLGGHCGDKICFLQPPPSSLAGGHRWEEHSDASKTEMDLASDRGGIWRYWDNGVELGNVKYTGIISLY